MAKTNPIGVRFDIEQMSLVKTRENLESPQQVLNFLLADYWGRAKYGGQQAQNSTNVSSLANGFPNSGIPLKSPPKDFKHYRRLVMEIETHEALTFATEVETSSILTPNEQQNILNVLKSRWL